MAGLSYANSGVDRQLADRFVEKIGLLSRSTLNRKVKSGVGGYASLFELNRSTWIAASTDGVGTKLKLAIRLKKHSTVGIDLVAMSVNDLLCVGAQPFFFLDYFATGKLDTGVGSQILEGIVEGCKQAQCALVGGETAEMPDFYAPGDYDLAGFAVGWMHPREVLPQKEIRAGDVLIGLASSGCHSNGYSLIRKLLPSGPEGDAQAHEFLTPTRIYARALNPFIRKRTFKGLAHITGSGFLNVPRMSERVSYEICLPPAKERPPVFEWLKSRSGLNLAEMAQTFNLGIGMVLVVSPQSSGQVIRALTRKGETAWEIGRVVKKRAKQPSQVILREGNESVTLDYL